MLDNDTKARQYCLAFQRPFADPDRKLQEAEKHALVVCSLAAIPPVSGMEGMEIDPEEEMDKWSSTKWAEHVRDVASGMTTLSPRVRQAVSMTALTLLDKLVEAVGVRYCTHCFFPGDECRCPVWDSTSTTTLTPASNVQAAYSSAVQMGPQMPVSGTMRPPPGYPVIPLDQATLETSMWHTMAASTQQGQASPLTAMKVAAVLDEPFPPLPTGPPKDNPPPPPPPTDESLPVQQHQEMDTEPAPFQFTAPQSAPIRQANPSTQSQERGERRTARGVARPLQSWRGPGPEGAGRGLRALQMAKAALAARSTARSQDRSRSETRAPSWGRKIRGRSSTPASTSRTPAPEASAPSASDTQVQAATPLGTSSGTSGGAAQIKKKNKNTGWKKDTPRLITRALNEARDTLHITQEEKNKMIRRVIDYMSERLAEWYVRREEEPLWYSTYVYTVFNRVNNIRVPTMEKEYSWILAGSYYHAALVIRGEVKRVAHLRGEPTPALNQPRPSEQALNGHANHYPMVLKAAKEAVAAYQKGDGPHEELRLKVLDTDRFLVQEASGYRQLLKIAGKSEAPAQKRRPIRDIPALFRESQVTESTPPKKEPAVSEAGDGWTSPKTRQQKRAKSNKPELQSDKGWTPDVLKDDEGRVNSARIMLQEACSQRRVTCPLLCERIAAAYPGKNQAYYKRIANGLFCSIQEFLLFSACRQTEYHSLVLTKEVEDVLPPLEDYLFEKVPGATYDEREEERSKILRVAVWLLRTDMICSFRGEANYKLDPEAEDWPESLVALMTLAGSLPVSRSDVTARLIHENKARIEEELEGIIPVLHEQEAAFRVLVERRDKRKGSVSKAVNPVEREKQQDLLDSLEDKVSNGLARVTSLRDTVKLHRARLTWYYDHYRKDTEPVEADESTSTEQPMEVTESERPPALTQQTTPQEDVRVVVQEEEPLTESTPSTDAPPPRFELPPPPPPRDEPVESNPPVRSPTEADEHDDDNVSLLADEDDADLDLSQEDEVENRSPPNSQDEQTLLDASNPQRVSPGVSGEMAALAVAGGQSPDSASRKSSS